MECPNCGQENRDVARFCQRCGTRFVIAEPTLAEPAETLEPTPGWLEDLAPVGEVELSPVPTVDRATEGTEETQDWAPEQVESTAAYVVPAVEAPSAEPASLPATAQEETPAPPLPEPDVLAVEASVQQETDAEPLTAPADLPDLAPEQEEIELPPDATEPSEPAPAGMEPSGPEVEDDSVFEEGLEPVLELADLDQVPLPDADQETALPDQHVVAVPELADTQPLPWGEEPEALEVLELGTVVDGRYRVIKVTETEPTHIQYQVRDLQRCPRCGTAGHNSDEAFCTACGALMDQKPIATMLQQPASSSQEPAGVEPEDHLIENGQSYWIWRESEPEDTTGAQERLMRMIVGQQSDTGQVRELDEDSIFALTMAFTFESVTHQLGLFVVADGMGGHEGGEVASRMAIQTTAQILLRDLFAPELMGNPLSSEDILDRMADAIDQANDGVYLERQKRENDMGTTITAAFVKDWTLHLAHVGDCRAYRWGKGGLQQLTTDHSIVAGMVAAGTILPEEIYTHPQRSVIYRCIGDQPTVEVDVDTIQLAPGERLLVCCDGLWEELRQAGIEDVLLAEADPQAACDLMVHQANLAGGSDNISVIIVQL